jgi:hypothetical protein
VSTVPLSELDALAHRFAGDRHDAYSERALARAYEEFLSRRRTPLAPIVLTADGNEYPSFYALLADPNLTSTNLDLRLDPPAAAGPPWEFLRPFERIVLRADGSAELHPLVPGPPDRAIARFLLREHFLPRSRPEVDVAATGGSRVEVPGFIGTLDQGLAACRLQALMPFSVAILVYLPEERVRYEFDLVRSSLLTDPRAGRLAVARRVRRTSRVSWRVDRAVGRGDLSMLAARCLEVLVESQGLTAVELANVFGGVRELVDSALQGLVSRQLVAFDRRTGVYRPRLEMFLPASDALPTGPSSSEASVANPALRTSVQELLAAADARATCPLCGNLLPPGPKTILCDDCAAKVGVV